MSDEVRPVPLSISKRLDDLEVLSKNPLLARMSLREVGTLLDLLDQIALTRGTMIFHEGEEGDLCYFVLEGQVRLVQSQVELRPAGAGDQFGELALVGAPRRTSSAEALTTVRLARMSRARYLSLAEGHPQIALHFTQALASVLGEALTSMTDRVGLLLRQRSLPRRTRVRATRDGVVAEVSPGTPVRALLPLEVDGAPVVAATLGRKPVPLDTPITSDAALGLLTPASAEGREIFRRSAGLVLLEAARRATPHLTLRMGPPIGPAQVVHMEGIGVPAEVAGELSHAYAQLVADDAPLHDEIWGLDEARSHMAERDWCDAAELLRSRRSTTATLLTCGATFALGLGPVMPSARHVAGARVLAHPEWLLIDFGEALRRWLPEHHGAPVDPVPAELQTPRYDGAMPREQRRWLAAMGAHSVGHFNDICVGGQVSELIRVAEGFHEKHIGRLADAVAAEPERIRIVAIAGPSSSGKTTFIQRLKVQLEVNGRHPVTLSLDDYYLDREKTPRDAAGEYDFEALEALDLARLHDHVGRLLRGEAVRTARFDFVTGLSHPEGGPELRLRAGDVLLVEGIHGLAPAIFGERRAEVYRIFVHPATTLPFDRLSVVTPEDVRLLRRIVRDRRTRGATAAESIARWPSVARGEAVHIYPSRPHADAVFDTSLVYEISVLKVYAERYLLEVPEDDPSFTTAWRLRQLIDRFVAIHPDHVPPTSIVREFIGGSGFTY